MRGPRATLPCLLFLPLLLFVPRAQGRVLSPAVRQVLATIDSLWTTGQRPVALSRVEAAVDCARAGEDSILLAQLLWRQGNFLVATGGQRRARPLLLEAAELATVLRDTSALCPALRWLALTDPGAAGPAMTREVLDRLIATAAAVGDRRHEGWGHVGLGYQAWRLGNAAEALIQYEAAAELFGPTEDVEGVIWSHNGIAMVRSSRGEYEQSLLNYGINAERAAAAGLPVAQGLALNNMGSLEYSLGRRDRALEDFRQAVRLFRESGRPQSLPVPLQNIGLCLGDMGRNEEAEQAFEEALRISEDVGMEDLLSQSRLKLAEFHLRLNDLDRAGDEYRRLLTLEPRADLIIRVESYYGLSLILGQQGKLAEAMSRLVSADSLLAGGQDLYRQLKTRGQMALVLEEMGRPAAALEKLRPVCARARQAGAMDMLVQGLSEMGNCWLALDVPDSALAAYGRAAEAWEQERRLLLSPRWRELRGIMGRAIYPPLAQLLQERGRSAEAWKHLQAYKGRTLLERMLGPGHKFSAALAGRGVQTVSLARMQQQVLQPGELFLDYALGDSISLVAAVTRDTMVFRSLPPAGELESSLRAFHDLLSDPEAGSPAAVEAVGRTLADQVLGGLWPLVRDSGRIIVSPDGAMNLIPFNSEVFGFAEEGLRWSRVPSAGILASIRGRELASATASPWPLLAVTGSNDVLPGVDEEAASLLRRYRKARRVTVEELTAGEREGERTGGCVLHVASHASNDDQSPWQSAIVLDPDSRDGRWRAADIAATELPPGVAVLSSCSTAQGRVLSGEGVVGLTAAFFSAGMPTVVSSLWPVDDTVTRDFMIAFYEALTAGLDVTEAADRARCVIRGNLATAQPCYWAGFVVAGEGRLKPRLAARGAWSRSRVMVLGLVGIAGVAMIWVRRKSISI